MIKSSSRLIQASAGTGKTFSLSGHFISLLLQGEDPGSILASTFTRKAAGEILERIYLRMARAVRNPEMLADQTGYHGLSSEQVGMALNLLISSQHQLKILTLDSFSVAIARLFAEELGLPQGWNILEEHMSAEQISDAVSAICSSLDSANIAALVTAVKKGETRRSSSSAIQTIVTDLLGLFQESDFQAWDWLKIPYPADQELQNIINELEQAELPKTKAGKVNQKFFVPHQAVLRLLRNKKWHHVIAQTLIQNAISNATFSAVSIPQQLLEALRKAATLASQHCLARLGDANRSAYGLLYAVLMELEQIEESSGKISFDRIVRRIVRHRSSIFSDELYFRLDSRIRHILLDEFQDTSLQQWQMLEPLIEEKLSSSDEISSFFCVGDGKQAIYGWRGGNTAIFDGIPLRWEQIAVETKEISYRSGPAIISFVNSFFASLQANPMLDPLRQATDRWLLRFKPHSSYQAMVPGSAGSDSISASVNFHAIEAEGDSQLYADIVFRRLEKLLIEDSQQSIAILVMKNDDVSHYMDMAQKRGLALSTQGGTPLNRFSMVTSLLALLRLLFNPADRISQHQAACSPWNSNGDLSTLLKNTLNSLGSCGLAQTIRKLADGIKSSLSDAESAALEQLLVLAVRFEISHSPMELRSFISLIESSSVPASANSNIQIMTIHKSKGLEFDNVIIPDLSWKLESTGIDACLLSRDSQNHKPLKISLYAPKDLRNFSAELYDMAEQKRINDFEESMSVLYVALTRAKSGLHMFAPLASLSKSSLTAAKLIDYCLPSVRAEYDSADFATWSESTAEPSSEMTAYSEKKTALQSRAGRFRGLGIGSPSSYIPYQNEAQSAESNEIFGTLIHRLFAITKWAEEVLPAEYLINLLCSEGAERAESVKAVDAFMIFLNLGDTPSLMQRPAADRLVSTKLFLEKPFIFREGNILIQGRIDRVVIESGKGRVIDFKAGKCPAADSAIFEGYKKQILSYKKAASILFPGVQFSANLLFLSEGRAIEV